MAEGEVVGDRAVGGRALLGRGLGWWAAFKRKVSTRSSTKLPAEFREGNVSVSVSLGVAMEPFA